MPIPDIAITADITIEPIFNSAPRYYSVIFKNYNDEIIAGVCEYGGEVVASLSQNNLFSTQFHPEKSGVAGLRILKNFTNLEI